MRINPPVDQLRCYTLQEHGPRSVADQDRLHPSRGIWEKFMIAQSVFEKFEFRGIDEQTNRFES